MIGGINNYYSIQYSYGYTSNTGMYAGYSASRPMRVSPADRIHLDYLSYSDDKFYPGDENKCKSRKYAGSSDRPDVFFKTPGHISPEPPSSVVSAHEQKHAENAIQEGNISGTEYVKTFTQQIQYQEENPYERSRKLLEGSFLIGQNIDFAA